MTYFGVAIDAGLRSAKYLPIYEGVAGDGINPFSVNITTTGHSLGGGLAGFVAAIFGKRATVFDNMAFQSGAA